MKTFCAILALLWLLPKPVIGQVQFESIKLFAANPVTAGTGDASSPSFRVEAAVGGIVAGGDSSAGYRVAWGFLSQHLLAPVIGTGRYPVPGGWSLWSLPRTTSSQLFRSILPGIKSAPFRYEGMYLSSDTITHGTGYWIRLQADALITYNGEPRYADTIPLRARWNLIGSVNDTVPVADIRQVPDSIIITKYFGYQGGYREVTALQPGKGYWVKSRMAGALIVKAPTRDGMNSPGGSIARSGAGDGETGLTSWNRITLSDAVSFAQIGTLYFGSAELPPGSYELPPEPPPDAPDVRFTSQRYAEIFSPGRGTTLTREISVHPAHPGVVVRWSMPEAGRLLRYFLVERTGNGDRTLTPLDAEGSIRIELSDTVRYLLHAESLPLAYRLFQNYPNPFNPSTTIRFQVPAAGRVSLELYDILGRKITTLLDEDVPAGERSVVWDAKGDAGNSSGVYFVRMKAGSFVETKKMLLVK